MRFAKLSDSKMKLSDKSLREIYACTPEGCTPREALEEAIKRSDVCFIYEDKVILGVYGKGNFFMFFGPVDTMPPSFYKELKNIRDLLLWRYGQIHSVVMCDDEKLETKFELRLARFLGAKIGKPYSLCGHKWISWEMSLWIPYGTDGC